MVPQQANLLQESCPLPSFVCVCVCVSSSMVFSWPENPPPSTSRAQLCPSSKICHLGHIFLGTTTKILSQPLLTCLFLVLECVIFSFALNLIQEVSAYLRLIKLKYTSLVKLDLSPWGLVPWFYGFSVVLFGNLGVGTATDWDQLAGTKTLWYVL